MQRQARVRQPFSKFRDRLRALVIEVGLRCEEFDDLEPVRGDVHKVVAAELKQFLTSPKRAEKAQAKVILEKVANASRTRSAAVFTAYATLTCGMPLPRAPGT